MLFIQILNAQGKWARIRGTDTVCQLSHSEKPKGWNPRKRRVTSEMLSPGVASSLLRAIEVSDVGKRLDELEVTQPVQERAFLQSSPESKKQNEG